MTGLAADFDTWGIPSSTFLAFYLTVAVVLTVGVLIHRRTLLAGRAAPPPDQLNPQQVAYLNGREDLAVWTSLGTLRSQGVIGVSADRRLTVDGPLPPAASQLDRAIHYAATQRVHGRDLRRTEWVERALTELRDGLDRHGLLVGPTRRAALRLGPLLLGALLLLGIARIGAGLANARPVGYLVLVVSGLAVLTGLLFVRVPWRTRAANTALGTLRARHRHLAPGSNPAYAVYGAAGVATAMALYGTASFWAMDPAFAEQAEIQLGAKEAGGYYGAGASGTTGGCGGGGCGSGGDGGGGGGGCGGGGCGG
ncbi:TIGR04222 domain-containing membrane protein [Micromonospora sp. FIMYZ51]|uniref:TIGR04222 domain-containing membrane protein n=1 Tax=Micromonospora sp. FIMYZ51 TaxID=3051832 RepID=UPI00311E5C61